MLFHTPKGLLALLLVSSLAFVHSQVETASPSPEPKSISELIKERTIADHTGINVTAAINSTAETVLNATEHVSGPAPSMMPSQAPIPALAPHPSASVPIHAPQLAPQAAEPAAANSSMPPTGANSTAAAEGSGEAADSPVATPISTPSATASAANRFADATGVNVTEVAVSAKDATVAGASVASSRYGSIVAGTLVAAVMIVGLAGTVVVWRRRRANAYQGLHDTELAMIRREH